MLVRTRTVHGLLCVVALVVPTSGCLSIGGKTTNVDDTGNTRRISALESRVNTLEQTLHSAPSFGSSPPPQSQPQYQQTQFQQAR